MVRAHVNECAIGSRDRFDLWCRLITSLRAERMAEIGVWRGEFAATMLRNCPEISTYYLIDPWRPLSQWNKPMNTTQEAFTEACAETQRAVAFAAQRTCTLRGTTMEVADKIPDNSLDVVYIDGDHTLRGITIDLYRMLEKVKPFGVIGGDDFFLDPWHHGKEYEPSLVYPYAIYFAEARRLPIFALPFQQFLVVNSPAVFSFTNISGVKYRNAVGCPSGVRVSKE